MGEHAMRAARTTTHDDSGFTLIELLVAIGVFSVLMTAVTTLTIQGLRTITLAGSESQIQAAQQVTLEQITRQLRYIDNPTKRSLSEGFLCATSTSASFFTASGSGIFDRVPYLVSIRQTESTTDSAASTIEMTVWTPVGPQLDDQDPASADVIADIDPDTCLPTLAETNATFTTPPITRLLPVAGESRSTSMLLEYATQDEDGSWLPVTPDAISGRVAPDAVPVIERVTVSLSDSDSTQGLSQAVILENQA